jgi:hypothetical protein
MKTLLVVLTLYLYYSGSGRSYSLKEEVTSVGSHGLLWRKRKAESKQMPDVIPLTGHKRCRSSVDLCILNISTAPAAMMLA